MALRFFCPGCWMEIGEKADRCPHCGYALTDFQGLSYDYVRKLGEDRVVCIGNGRNDRLMWGRQLLASPLSAKKGHRQGPFGMQTWSAGARTRPYPCW
jgi:hypothetical protein